MRTLRLAATALLAASLTGSSACFVLDELDSGTKEIEKYGAANGSKAAQKPPAAKPAASGASAKGDGQPPRPTGKSWWQTAKTLASEEGNTEISGCRLGGRVEFMLRDDCLARGGQPD